MYVPYTRKKQSMFTDQKKSKSQLGKRWHLNMLLLKDEAEELMEEEINLIKLLSHCIVPQITLPWHMAHRVSLSLSQCDKSTWLSTNWDLKKKPLREKEKNLQEKKTSKRNQTINLKIYCINNLLKLCFSKASFSLT